VRSVHEAVVRALSAATGLIAGVLSAIALGLAALAGPVLGLGALLATPVRALVSRLRGRTSG
jgi:hypothetical protein